MRSVLKLSFIITAMVILLAGCGFTDAFDSGSGNGSNTPSGSGLDFYGVAAIGAPAVGYTVYLQSADGKIFEAVADGNGGYRINADGIEAPFLLWFELDGGEKVYAITYEDGVVNLNAITSALTKAAYSLSGGDVEEMDLSSFNPETIEDAEQALADFMEPVLELYGIQPESFDPLQMADFVADGFGMDGILDDFDISYDDTAKEIRIKIKGAETEIGALDIDGVRNNQENVENINSASLTSVTASMVAKVASNITFTAIAGENTSANNVVTALNLFTTYKNGTTVTWTSSDEAVSADGTITRKSNDTTVTLTATVSKGEFSSSKSLTVLIKAEGSDGGSGGGDDSYSMLGNNKSADSVIFNLNLATELSDGTTISWESSAPEYINTEGKLLKRPTVSEGSKTVILTAVETKGSASETVTYTVTIPSIIPKRMATGTILKEDGTIWQIGEISKYTVGSNGLFYNNEFTQEPTGANDWVSVSGNSNYTLAIKSDGTLWGWGANYYKQLSSEDTNLIETPFQIGTDNDWVDVHVGIHLDVAVALKADGTAWVWGSNRYDIIPSEDGEPTQLPAQESSHASDWADVQVGYIYITGLKTDGTIWSWGKNYFGGFGNAVSYDLVTTPVQESTKSTDWVSMDVYSGTAAIKKDGTLWLWGGTAQDYFSTDDKTAVTSKSGPSYHAIEAPIQEPSLSKDWVKPFFGENIGGIKSDGTIWSFGSGNMCGFGNGLCEDSLGMVQESTKSTDWVDAKKTTDGIYALKSDGTLWGWGINYRATIGSSLGNLNYYTPTVYDKKSFVLTDKGPGNIFCGIEADGDLWCKGITNSPMFIQVSGSWKDVKTDGYGVWGIKTDDTLWFLGTDVLGIFGGGYEYQQYIEPLQIGTAKWKQLALHTHDGPSAMMMGIQTDGTLWAIGSGAYYDGSAWVTTDTFVKLSDDTWDKVILGHNRLAIKSDGTLWAWSSGDSSGLGGVNPAAYPVQVGTDTWKDVAIADGYFGIGIKSDGKLYAWGRSHLPFLFDENDYSYSTPTLMDYTDTDWEKVWVDYGYFAALKSDGSLYTAGHVETAPISEQGLGENVTSTNTLRRVDGTYSYVNFMNRIVYAKGTDGKDYVWGNGNSLEYAEPNPIKIMD